MGQAPGPYRSQTAIKVFMWSLKTKLTLSELVSQISKRLYDNIIKKHPYKVLKTLLQRKLFSCNHFLSVCLTWEHIIISQHCSIVHPYSSVVWPNPETYNKYNNANNGLLIIVSQLLLHHRQQLACWARQLCGKSSHTVIPQYRKGPEH